MKLSRGDFRGLGLRKRKLEINPNQLNETFNEDMDTTDPKVLIGHGWSIYKK